MPGVKWTDKEIDTLRELYSFTKNEELSKILNKPKDGIRKKATRLGLRTNRSVVHQIYTVDSNFFKSPNLINSYIAGFTLADGYIVPQKRIVTYKLSNKDHFLLENIVKVVNFTGPIHVYPEKTPKGRDILASWLTIVDFQCVLDLEKTFGVCYYDKKNNICKSPPNTLSYDNQIAFIHGIIDGDGSIYVSDKGRIEITVCGSEELVKWIRDVCSKINGSKYKNFRKYGNVFVYKVSGKKAVKLIKELNKFEDIEKIHLSRKWDKIKLPGVK
jgi:hypothetical protein